MSLGGGQMLASQYHNPQEPPCSAALLSWEHTESVKQTHTAAFFPSDGLNSWFGEANCETTYEWELVRWPGLELVASSSQTISPCGNSACTGSGLDRGCSGIVADIATLAGASKP